MCGVAYSCSYVLLGYSDGSILLMDAGRSSSNSSSSSSVLFQSTLTGS